MLLLAAGRLWAAAECDCLPRFSAADLSLREAERTLLIDSFVKGDFQTAHILLDRVSDPNSPWVRDLRTVLDQYHSAQEQWQQQTGRRSREVQDKIDSLRISSEETPPSRPDEILGLILQARQLAGEEDSQDLRTDPFAVSLTGQIERKISGWQSRGEYEKAWRYGLRMLLLAEPDSRPLQERRDDLLEKVAIERDLTVTVCPGQADPYIGMRAEVLYKGLSFLEKNYAVPVDFTLLIRAADAYCRRLGQVLGSGRSDFLYAAEPNHLDLWNQEVQHMGQESAAVEEAQFASGLCVQRIQRIVDLNRRTLRLPEGFLVHGLSAAMLGELDPYTEIVWPSRSEDFDKQMTGEFAGVGIRITLDEKKLKILEVVAGSPAQESGRLKADDWIKAIDGLPTQSLSLDCAVRQISGPAGTTVSLTLERDGQEEVVSIVRRKIVLPTLHGTTPTLSEPIRDNGDLSAYRIDRDERIGYVWISNFRQETPQTLCGILKQLEAGCLIGLLLDLRSNSGGVLESAAAAANLFLTEGVIVKSQTRQGQRLEFDARADQVLKDIPIVVLVDGSTASGAEILAGALSEPGRPRATLVGTRTYGKGSVQEVEPLAPDGSRIKYTRGFYTLSGDRQVANRYQLSKQGRRDWGLLPDVEVPLKDHQAGEVQKVQRRMQEFSAQSTDREKVWSEETIALLESLVRSDPQMATGLTILKAKILAGRIRPQGRPDPNEPIPH